MEPVFEKEYKKLNKEQKEAVEAISGPVMVVAGPGTGKTQILALRIANILKKTDVKADGILCLTFTNSAVRAMQERLVRYIGKDGEGVNVFTFHSFGLEIIKKYFGILGLKEAPGLLEDGEASLFFDEILNTNDFNYLRPRSDATRYFKDLRSLISLMKRERISQKEFLEALNREISYVSENEDNISTRGASKGELKQEALRTLGGLENTREVAKFLEIYEETKRAKNMIDYDDVLEYLVAIVEHSKDALSDIREQYLYVLVDEHQDSSRVQNEFLKLVWGPLEDPDIFVVGDDRQLIYGFSGASIDHFKGFKKTFPKARLIPLVENYRSTQIILDAAHALLPSALLDDKLKSQTKEHHPIRLVSAPDPESEIMAAASDLKEKIKQGLRADDCAILVPKNSQARRAMEILHREGIPVAISESLSFFDHKEGEAMLRVLKILDTQDPSSLALSFFDEISDIPSIEAHKFLTSQNMREFSFEKLGNTSASLFEENAIDRWISKLRKWQKDAKSDDLKSLVETIGKELSGSHIVPGEDLARTINSLIEKKKGMSLHDLVVSLDKVREYGEELSLVVSQTEGVQVLTMHSSKGLEFDYVWIAHMDERSLSGGKRSGFVLPESISEKIEERDIDAVKRKLFVAITRAKRFCVLSYAQSSSKGSSQELAEIISSLPEEVFTREEFKTKNKKDEKSRDLSDLKRLVGEKYPDRYVSASLLNNFFECPWKWYFRNILNLPEPKAEILEFGSAVHAAIERIITMDKVPTVEELEKIAKEEVEKTGFGNDNLRMRTTRDVFKIINSWTARRLPEIRLSRKTEEGISASDRDFPHLKIFGKIDLIENLSGKEVRVTDFKTGTPKKKYDIEKMDGEGKMSSLLRQLAMYSYLLENNPKWRADVRESRLEFLEAKNSKEYFYDRIISREEVEKLRGDMAEYDMLAKSGDWAERECRYNSYGKNTECEYCKLAEVFQ